MELLGNIDICIVIDKEFSEIQYISKEYLLPYAKGTVRFNPF